MEIWINSLKDKNGVSQSKKTIIEIMRGRIRDLQDRFMNSNRNILVLGVAGGEKGTDGWERIKLFVLHFCFQATVSLKLPA